MQTQKHGSAMALLTAGKCIQRQADGEVPAHGRHVAFHSNSTRPIRVNTRPISRLQGRPLEPHTHAARLRLLRRLRRPRKPLAHLQRCRLLPAVQDHDHPDRRPHQLRPLPQTGHTLHAGRYSGDLHRRRLHNERGRQDRSLRRHRRDNGILLHRSLPDLDRQEDRGLRRITTTTPAQPSAHLRLPPYPIRPFLRHNPHLPRDSLRSPLVRMRIRRHGLDVQSLAIPDHRANERAYVQHRQSPQDHTHLEHRVVPRGQDPEPKRVVRCHARAWWRVGVLAPSA